MLLEGVVLWAFIWFFRNRKPFKGFLVSMYLILYGLVRFILEYFRQPDSDIGYRFQIIPTNLSIAEAHPPLSFSTGQVLCFAMILAGVILLVILSRLPDREAVRVYPATMVEAAQGVTAEEKRKQNEQARKLRKKLQK
jgi:phosphatidylglycerol:prolipoprotein diacylglycerol transferase